MRTLLLIPCCIGVHHLWLPGAALHASCCTCDAAQSPEMTTSSRIGDKLLAVRAARELRVLALPDCAAAQGWTLLGECCPRAGCATPLLRARTPGAKLYCPQHDGFVEAADGARVARRCGAAPA